MVNFCIRVSDDLLSNFFMIGAKKVLECVRIGPVTDVMKQSGTFYQ